MSHSVYILGQISWKIYLNPTFLIKKSTHIIFKFKDFGLSKTLLPTRWALCLTPELTCLRPWDGDPVVDKFPSLSERLSSASRWNLRSLPILPNTGLAQRPPLRPPTVSENTGLLQVGDFSGVGRFFGRPGLSGNTGLLGREDVDLTEEVRLSSEQKMNPRLQSPSWGSLEPEDISCWAFLPNTGLLKYSGLRSVSVSSPWSIRMRRKPKRPSEQQSWDALAWTLTGTSREKVWTSLRTNKVSFGQIQNSVNHPASPIAKKGAGKQAVEIHWSLTVISWKDRFAIATKNNFRGCCSIFEWQSLDSSAGNTLE